MASFDIKSELDHHELTNAEHAIKPVLMLHGLKRSLRISNFNCSNALPKKLQVLRSEN